MKPQKALMYLSLLYISAKIVSLIASHYISATTPPVVREAENKAKNDSLILKKIGGYRGFETHYNENDFKDSVATFSIKIVGSDRNATIKFKSFKNAQGRWHIIQSDTIYFK